MDTTKLKKKRQTGKILAVDILGKSLKGKKHRCISYLLLYNKTPQEIVA